MREIDHNKNIENIFRTLNPATMELAAREGPSLEFKEAFNWASKDRYAKTMAAYANNKGGYIIFGVTNHPRRLVGLERVEISVRFLRIGLEPLPR